MGNTSVSTFGYDSANRTTSVTHSTSGSVTLASYQYSYDNASNVSTRTDSDGTVTTFGYDANDQVTSEVRDNSHSSGYSNAFVYDHNANRTSKVQGGVTTSYSYDNHDKLTSAGSKSYGYDLNGNCTTVSVGTNTTTLTYDVENRVVGISYPGGGSNSFAYNGDDLRTQKVDSSGTQNYVTDGSSPASAVLKDGNAVYTPGLSEKRGTASKFYHGDALGSTRGITDNTQAVTDSQLYDAFGNTVSRTGTTPPPFGFVGAEQYQSDSDSGLQLLGHRYYDPSIGRFLSSDPAEAGTNWYAYCDNNPLKKIDPLGEYAWLLSLIAVPVLGEVIVGVAVIVVVVVVVGVVARGLANTYPPSITLPAPPIARAVPIVRPIIIPRRGTGPSGEPKRHFPRYPTKKAAREGAGRNGPGKPEHHPNPDEGGPHYHPTDPDNNIIPDGVHHVYPR